ncbi:MAG: T9SS type A sorting domain-containing protein [Bacteroidota bacterium]
MKYFFLVLLTYVLLFHSTDVRGQTIAFAIADKQPTADGSGLTFDVTLASTSSFKLGSGLLYFNYNTAAFGPNVVANGRMTISYPDGAVLGQTAGFPVYRDFVQNDNTESRFAFSFQQGLSAGSIPEDNITGTPAVLFRVTLAYETGGETQPDDICFESSDVFDDQFFTACGPDGLGFPDCFGFPGTQLTDDVFNCAADALPVEFLAFTAAPAGKQVQLRWTTTNEQNNDFFAVERSEDGDTFIPIGTVTGAGTTNLERHYESWDDQPHSGLNYYRLKQVDFDGSYTYSDVRAVQLSSAVLAVSVYPNPASVDLNIRFSNVAEQGTVQLLSSAGQVVREQFLAEGLAELRLPVQQLPSGAYWLRATIGSQNSMHKVIITR